MSEEMSSPTKVACFGLVAGIAVCFWQLAGGGLTSRETIFFTSALAVLSIAASWFVSKHYSEQSNARNLQVFGRKAYEKVNNLSNELNKLMAFLQQELEADDDASSGDAILSKRMKIEAAIHMIGTLKSINEGSLSDWQAVIGDEIVEQKEKQEEKEETLREILDMMKGLPANATSTERPEQEEGDEQSVQKEISSIRQEIRLLATQVSGVPIKNAQPKKRKERVEKICPRCAKPLTYSQKTKPNSTKALTCPHCGMSLVSLSTGDGFTLVERTPVEEKIECPNCKSEVSVLMDPLIGSAAELQCGNCKGSFRATRQAKGIRLRPIGGNSGIDVPSQLSEELLGRIKQAMGRQPWPSGRSRQVSNQLGVSHAVINSALQVLVSRGDFLLQHNGKLFAPVAVAPPAK